jgi:ABC-2 type transport system permease protein/sodium transport system permease protein
MIRASRISAIYRKELADILRDRRTLMAMILIPVVLYPLLMIAFLRAAESDESKLKAQTFLVEVDSESDGQMLRHIIEQVRSLQDPAESQAQATFDIQSGQTPPEYLGESVHLHVSLRTQPTPPPFLPRLLVEIHYTEVDVRSRTAMNELTEIIDRYRAIRARESLSEVLGQAAGDAGGEELDVILNPVEIHTRSTASEQQRGGWALGQIVPIVLVLMTITGAIYPAIDLTTGERERGTLEALISTPVPTLHLIVGKFLVVATVAMLTAVLNLASVGATMHFGGLTQAITTHMPVKFPLHVLPIIMICMVPFALLFSAILVAVCSFARTFKEAQNYVMPVIIGSMIPGFGVLLPSVELRGAMLVLPVGNMVLLTRELFQQTYDWTQVMAVLLSTTLYAAAAVAVAARLFGQEAVLFADAGSYRAMFQRRYFKPAPRPSASQALLLIALLFPASFYAQSLVMGASLEDFLPKMRWLAIVQFFGLFVVLPLVVCLYLKIDPVETFRLRWPPLRGWLAALLVGLSSWALAREFFRYQSYVLPPSKAMHAFEKLLESQLSAAPLWLVVLLLAVVPAICEEFLFRGFLLSGLSTGLRKWQTIFAVGLIFGVYHFMIERIPVTALMGIVLAYLCWQSRSIFPAMLAHALHNGLIMALSGVPEVLEWLGLTDAAPDAPLPPRVLIPALLLFAAGVGVAISIRGTVARRSQPEISD